ncbi:MAG: 3-deoxy-7-phosphoheptulonate synthase [Gammaproteobacteria bacterium]|nr:3-deoxy-7-phosphoheptulonate synthase [Gammaproteobacteria bacterium]
MNYTVIKPVPSIEEICQIFPLSPQNYQKIQCDREEVKNILTGTDNRLLMIVGPCSAWPNTAVLEYAEKLVKLNERVKHALKIIMRVYIQKPRTTTGWTGPVNQPDPCRSPDILKGMFYAREMMVNVIKMGLPIADEALFMCYAKSFLELLTWIAIGARSAENPEHRVFASMLNCPVGLKNPTHGSLTSSVNSIVAAQHQHITLFEGNEIKTLGNPYAHLVLRGSNNNPNYSIEHLKEVKKNLDLHSIKNPALIIDVSHDNCILNGKKNHQLQPLIINQLLTQLHEYPHLKKLVKGFMVESFLKEGNQKIPSNSSDKLDLGGLSITDPCLSWDQTEEMLLQLASII